jgi:hypothetical protein
MASDKEAREQFADGAILPFARRSLAAFVGVDGPLVATLLSGAGSSCSGCSAPTVRPENLTQLEIASDESIVAFGITCGSIADSDRDILASALDVRYAVACDGRLVSVTTNREAVLNALILRVVARSELPSSIRELSELLHRIPQGLAIFAGRGRDAPLRQLGSLSLHGTCVFCSGRSALPELSHFRSGSSLIVCPTCKGRGVPPIGCGTCGGTGLALNVRTVRFQNLQLGEVPRWSVHDLMTDPFPKAPETMERLLALVSAGFGDYPIGFLTEWFSAAEHDDLSRLVRKAVGADLSPPFETNKPAPMPLFPTIGYRNLLPTSESDLGEAWAETDEVGSLPKFRFPLSNDGMTFVVGPPSSGKSQIVSDLIPRLFRRRQQEALRASFAGLGKVITPDQRRPTESTLGMSVGLWPIAARQFAGLPESRQAAFTERSFLPSLSELPCPECQQDGLSESCPACRGTGLDPSLLLLRSGSVEFGDWLTRHIERLDEVRWMGENELFVVGVMVRLGLGHARLIDHLPKSANVVPEIFSLLRAVLEMPVTGRRVTGGSRRTLVIVDGLLDAVHSAAHFEIVRDIFEYMTNHGGAVLSASRVFPPEFHSCPDHVIALRPVAKLRTPAEMGDRLYPPHLSEVSIWTAN